MKRKILEIEPAPNQDHQARQAVDNLRTSLALESQSKPTGFTAHADALLLLFFSDLDFLAQAESVRSSTEQRNGSRGSSTVITLHKFSTLEKFVRSHRLPSITRNDPFIRHWLTRVAPSCVFKVPGTIYYRCVFCQAPIIAPNAIVRHYREKHAHQIPAGIFGPIETFPCRPCGQVFRRRDHLETHFLSRGHINTVAAKGSKKATQQRNEYHASLNDYNFKRRMAFKRVQEMEAEHFHAPGGERPIVRLPIVQRLNASKSCFFNGNVKSLAIRLSKSVSFQF